MKTTMTLTQFDVLSLWLGTAIQARLDNGSVMPEEGHAEQDVGVEMQGRRK